MGIRSRSVCRRWIAGRLALAVGLGCSTLVVVAAPSVARGQSASPQAAVAEEHPLSLPAHPERQAPQAENSRPKASQPNRQQHRTVPTQSVRTGSRMPMPGRPARNLPELSLDEAEEIEDSEDEETPEDAASDDAETEDPGLIRQLPHQVGDEAVTLEYIYTGESFSLTTGGRSDRQVTNYRGNVDVVLTFDFEKLGLWKGARFFLYSNNVHGRPLSVEDVGDYQLFSNIDSTIGEDAQGRVERPHYTAVGEYWYEQVLCDDLVRFKVGKQDSNADFAYTDLGGDFVNTTFAMPTMIPLPTWPSQALGVSTFWTLLEDLTLGVGVYDGTLPSGPQGVRWGFDTLGDNGAVSLYQLEWTPPNGPNGELPTTLRVGAWHHSDRDAWTTFATDPTNFSQNYGYWVSLDQMLWKEQYCADNDQGLGIFGQFGWAPGDRNEAYETIMGGIVYKGWVEGRDEDLMGIGFTTLRFSPVFRDFTLVDSGDFLSTRETAVEAFYKLILSPYLSVQPDVQYISHPGGLYKDALLAGVRFELVL